MLITKIEKLKNNKYKIIIDDEKIITFDNVILDNNLLYKKVIDKEALSVAAECCKVVPAKLGEQIGDYAAIATALL